MPPTKKPPEFGTTRRLQREYEAGMRTITGRVLSPKQQEETFEQWRARLAMRSREPDIQSAAEFLARKMYQWTNVKNAKTWREAAARSGRNRMLFKLLTAEMQTNVGSRVHALVRENARLITSLSLTAADTLTSEILKAQQSGARAGTIAKMYRVRLPELLSSRIHLLGRTETAKASTALTQARCEELAIDFYIWETARDGDRVRQSHRNMQGVVVPWGQAPAPELLVGEKTQGHYHSGQIYNCRCTQIPVLTLDDIKFPARVYWHGAIQRMNRQQFKAIAVGLEQRVA